jgi:hypothetical protein
VLLRLRLVTALLLPILVQRLLLLLDVLADGAQAEALIWICTGCRRCSCSCCSRCTC